MRTAVTTAAILLSLAIVTTAGATTNPVRLYGAPMSCPDPDVFNYGHQYVAACTSDFGQHNPEPREHRMGPVPAAFPIYVSSDLQHWRFVNYIFPPGHSVRGAPAPTGQWPGGEYWAPEIHKIGARWVAYFGARLSTNGPQMALFVAWTHHLFGGHWSSKLLYRHHGVIDPSVARIGGRLFIVYCQQPSQIWGSELSADGLEMLPYERQIAHPTLAWEDGQKGSGVEDGPVLWRHDRRTFILYNAASTWNDSYKVGLLEQTTGGSWWKAPQPLVRSGSRLVSVGIGAQPFRTPKGLEVAVHVQFNPARHRMEGRYLSFLPLALTSVAAQSPRATDELPEVPGGVAHVVRPTGPAG
jgi:arabinan endo-1,5-alpha-L-arabinosidase